MIRMIDSKLQKFIGRIPAHKNRKERQECGRTPHDREHDSELMNRYYQRIIQRLNNRVIAIDAYAAQV